MFSDLQTAINHGRSADTLLQEIQSATELTDAHIKAARASIELDAMRRYLDGILLLVQGKK